MSEKVTVYTRFKKNSYADLCWTTFHQKENKGQEKMKHVVTFTFKLKIYYSTAKG